MSLNVSNSSSTSQANVVCESLHDSYYLVKVSKIVGLCIVLLCSFVGNALIIIMVYKRKELRKTVNYFIANMAVSDFVFPLTAIPVGLAETPSSPLKWPISGTAGLIFCKLNIFLMSVSLTVSIESLVWIALDRFVAVVLPLKVHLISTRFRALAIVSTWIMAIVINSVDLYQTNLVEEYGKINCKKQTETSFLIFKTYAYVRIALVYIAPLILITILYCAIAVTLRRQDKALRLEALHRNVHKRKRQAIKMSICVMVAFYLLFIPFTVVVLLWYTLEAKSCLLAEVLWLISSLALCLSSTTNPILCFTFVENYRCGLKEIFKSCRSERLRRRNMENGHQEEITLQRIRVIPEAERISHLSITKKGSVNPGFVYETAN